jgi:hypothetical protein
LKFEVHVATTVSADAVCVAPSYTDVSEEPVDCI